MTSNFLELVKSKETVLVYHGAKGETVILSEKQPHRNTERLFEHFSPKERFMLECALDSRCECELSIDGHICEITMVSGRGVAAIAPAGCDLSSDNKTDNCFARLADIKFDTDYDLGLLFADDALSKIASDLGRVYPDMELELSVNCENKLFELSISNLIRICMLCAGIADTVSFDRKIKIDLRSTEEELGFSFSTGCKAEQYKEEAVEDFVSLARFVCEREGGKFEILRENEALEMNFVFRSHPDEMPEFKFRDQFFGYIDYFSKIEREMRALRAEEQSKH